jgi:membrane protein DedA with SNARE-associated domain
MGSFLHSDIAQLLNHYGYWAVAGMVGLESIGIPLPGEATLIAAAIYAGSTHRLSIGIVIAAAFAGAVIGDNIGFSIGRRLGFRFVVRYGRYLRITERRVKLGQYLFWRHGGKVVFFGRFVTVLRALAAFLAGVNRMEWARFLLFNATGGAIWAALYGAAAYELGNAINRLSDPIGIATFSIAILAVIAGFVLVRRHEEALADKAEQKFPGPLGLSPRCRHDRRA